MATTAQRTRRNGGSEGMTEWSSTLARETTRDAQEALRLAAEVQGSTLDALGQSLSGWSTPQPAMDGWERLLNGMAQLGDVVESSRANATGPRTTAKP
jgi:hypothetical protein